MHARSPQVLGWSAALGVAVTVTALPGCQKPLLSPDRERTQFDRYDTIRNQRANQYEYDAYERRRINLRDRLLPRG
jgi:hypothetical protein